MRKETKNVSSNIIWCSSICGSRFQNKWLQFQNTAAARNFILSHAKAELLETAGRLCGVGNTILEKLLD
jgi:hypothetical protein